jgi:hypothetical protein
MTQEVKIVTSKIVSYTNLHRSPEWGIAIQFGVVQDEFFKSLPNLVGSAQINNHVRRLCHELTNFYI